jgi:6-phosphogluconolactonase
MQNVELIRFSNDSELAVSVGKRWASGLEALGETGRPYGVALSGGRIAARLFSVLAELAADRVDLFKPVHFFWGDERCVPPDDPESNFGLAQRLLLRPLAIPEGRVHRVRGEDQPKVAAARAAADLRGVMSGDAEDLPVLDLIFLGMGEDGHVASLFPGEGAEWVDDPAIYRPVVAVKPPPNRITFGYRTIAAAREVWVLASGAGKERALQDSLKPGGQTPLARVLKLRARTRIFTDILSA